MNTEYTKIRFTSKKNGSTAGLIIETDKLNRMNLGDISRFYPYSEANKMQYFERSPSFPTWEDAFNYSFETGN